VRIKEPFALVVRTPTLIADMSKTAVQGFKKRKVCCRLTQFSPLLIVVPGYLRPMGLAAVGIGEVLLKPTVE
jgi:hypothetical protein